MAVLALGFIGSAIGAGIGGSILGVTAATIGGFIGSTLGSMLDNQLFPQKAEGPRLDDLSVTASTYGKVIPKMWGPENRVAGNIIWSTGLIETKKKKKQGGKGAPSVSVTEYSYRCSLAIALGAGELRRFKKIWANNKLMLDVDGTPPTEVLTGDELLALVFSGQQPNSSKLYEAIRFYPGNFIQEPDPTIEAYEGAGNVPAYRGTAYVVIEDLQLADYGNRIPNLEFLVEAQEEVTVGAICTEICALAGIDPNTVSTSTLQGTVRGFAVGNKASGVGALQPLALVYDFDVGEHAGGLRCQARGTAPLGVVRHQDLAGHENGNDRPDTIRWNRGTEAQLPREAVLTFPDPDRDFQPNSQRAIRASGSADSNLSSQVAVVLSADHGRRVADRMLWEAWTGRQFASTTTDDRWVGMQTARCYIFETPAGLEPLRVVRKTRGWNGVIELDLRRDRANVYKSTSTGAGAATPPQTVPSPGESEIILLDIPLLLDADNVTQASGFYWGLVGSGAGWRGGDALRGLDVGGPFEELGPEGVELTVGEVADALPAPAGDIFADPWDDVNTILVELRREDMELTSATADELAVGANAIWLGDLNDTPTGEIMQFGTATLVTGGVYELSHLKRGQRGTEFAAELHGAGETLVLLEPSALNRSDFGTTDLGQERAYKGVSLLTLEADADAVLFTNEGTSLRPYEPVNLTVTGDTGDNLDLDWVRRSRVGNDVSPPPLAEDAEAYEVRIMNAAGTVIVRTANTTAPTFLYTLAMQTADFGGAVSDLRWRVAQVSAVYGPGVFAEHIAPV